MSKVKRITIPDNGSKKKIRFEEKVDNTLAVGIDNNTTSIDLDQIITADELDRESSQQLDILTESDVFSITSPMPGTIQEVLVKPKNEVEEKQVLVRLIAMKMENEITSPGRAVVKKVFVKPGQSVQAGDLLIEFEE